MTPRKSGVLRAASALALGAAMAALTHGAALAACSVPRFSFTFGGQSYASMTTHSGTPCTIKLREGSGTIITSIITLARPGKGSLKPLNSVNIAYQARPGFKGEDKFTIGIVGTKNGARGTARVTVAVWVVGDGPHGQRAVAAPAPNKHAARGASSSWAETAISPGIAGAAKATYAQQIVAHLNRHKRYPESARSRREQGTVMLTFTLDRRGRLISRQISRGSGHRNLDREALDMLRRAQPFPAPPAELTQQQFRYTAPMAYYLNDHVY
ncbi:MAG TPA: energy transducer TonB [Xanthobacteraceae bacterium]|nr:energy transducer TonB [Xanthobacteraceae bacterium]